MESGGLLFGLIMVGFLVWLVRSLSRARKRDCPFCERRMIVDATVCAHCQRESDPWVKQDDIWFRRGQAGGWEYRQPAGDGGVRWLKAPEGTVIESAAM